MSIQRLLTECLAKIPDVTVSDQNPAILDTLQMNPEDPFIPREHPDTPDDQNQENDEEMEPRTHAGRVIADGSLRKNGIQTADLKIITTFDEQPVPMLIDITVKATHVVSHHPRTIIGANGDRYSSKLADFGAHEKDNYLHDGNAIGFAFDFMGGISQSAKDCIDHLYARGLQEKRRRWDSETMRIALKKELLD